MIRIAIVEDDRHDREALKKCLNRYEKENQVKFSVTEFQDGEDIVTDYTASYDLIILDIEMAFLNGMKAAEKIRELDTNVIIIFIKLYITFFLSFYILSNVRKALFYRLYGHFYFLFTFAYRGISSYVFPLKRGKFRGKYFYAIRRFISVLALSIEECAYQSIVILILE